MRILITNDDGYMADGIRKLASRLAENHDVTVVAPDSEHSGYAHMVNFFGAITYFKADMQGGIETYAVDGTPADCVIFAVKHLFKDRPFDLVISGINSGLNIGSDVIYSGTVGAAQEGTFHGIPSIAVSLRWHEDMDYDFAADFVAENLETLKGLTAPFITINVNLPATKREMTKGVRVAPITYRPYEENYYSKKNNDGQDVFYIDGHPDKTAVLPPDGDCELIKQGYITVSPIRLVPNDEAALLAMRGTEFKL